MKMQDIIQAKIVDALNPAYLNIENESHNHGGPATESHFKLTVAADEFSDLSAVKRHQRVYGILAEELKGSVHALALHLYAPQQWAEREASAPQSPDCRGGSRKS